MRPMVRNFSLAAWYGAFSLRSPSCLATLASRNASFFCACVDSNRSPSSQALTVDRMIFSFTLGKIWSEWLDESHATRVEFKDKVGRARLPNDVSIGQSD